MNKSKSDLLIEQALKNHYPWKAEIIRRARIYLEKRDITRNNSLGFSSCRGPKNHPAWKEYYRQNNEYEKAYANLLIACDVEFSTTDEDQIRACAWEWKYWKVMARKCCHYQKSPVTDHLAAETMAKMSEAESNLMKACGLDDYKDSCHYLEKHFPNLRSGDRTYELVQVQTDGGGVVLKEQSELPDFPRDRILISEEECDPSALEKKRDCNSGISDLKRIWSILFKRKNK